MPMPAPGLWLRCSTTMGGVLSWQRVLPRSGICSFRTAPCVATFARILQLFGDRRLALLGGPVLPSPSSAARAGCRHFASKMKKDQPSRKEGAKLQATDEELSELVDMVKCRQQLQRIVDELKADLAQQLPLRTSVAAFDHLLVEAEGKKYPLNTLAQISQRSPHLVALNLAAAPQYISAAKAAIASSGLNVNPQQDGTTLFVPLPKVTREHRENLAKSAKTMCDRAKVKLRDVQNKHIRDARKQKESLSSDLLRAVEDRLHAVAHEYADQADALAKAKQDELLTGSSS